MRDILFRGKRIDNSVWIEGDLRHWRSGKIGIHDDATKNTREVDPETVGQYTGKRDSKNDRIFEGDILHIKWRTLDLAENAVVRYDDRSCAYILQMRGAAWSYMSHLDAAYMQIESFEVIGNMWDDPELMEGINAAD